MKIIQKYISTLQQTLDRLPQHLVVKVIEALERVRLQGRQVFIMGNGGSASTASHFVCDLAKNTRRDGSRHYRVIGLTDNMAIFSAYANDEGYESVFAKQLENLLLPGDIVIGISASGNSANVFNALHLAKERGAMTIAFTGFDGGRIGKLVDINIQVMSDIIEHVEDVHLVLEHMIVKAIKEGLPLDVNSSNILMDESASVSGD